jgi:hypothetical protein
MKKVIILLIIIVAVIIVGGYLTYAKLNPSGLYIPLPSRTLGWKTYINNDYGFRLTFTNSWKGYEVNVTNWQGNRVDNFEEKFSGPEIIFKNPQSTPTQSYQDIPIMVINHATWNLIDQELVAVSAAPIGPAKIGENSKYVFATPPRWYGFTDAIGFQEALDIVKTFKAF